MPKKQRYSAGILLYREGMHGLEVLLVHPGGPYWQGIDIWGLPKGELEPGEDPLIAAQREFHEETGLVAVGPFMDLGSIRQSSGKIVKAFAAKSTVLGDPEIVSNTCKIMYRGKELEIPEVDAGRFFPMAEAKTKTKEYNWPLFDELVRKLAINDVSM